MTTTPVTVLTKEEILTSASAGAVTPLVILSQQVAALQAGGGSTGSSAAASVPALSTFTNQNLLSGTVVVQDPTTKIITLQSAYSAATNKIQSFEQPLTQAANWTLKGTFASPSPNEPFMSFGLALRDSVSGKIIIFSRGAQYAASGIKDCFGVQYWTNADSFSSTKWIFASPRGAKIYAKLHDDGTNLVLSVSSDGQAPYARVVSIPHGEFTVPDRVGGYLNPPDSSNTGSQFTADFSQWELTYG